MSRMPEIFLPVRTEYPAGMGTVIVPGTGCAGAPLFVNFCVRAGATTFIRARFAVDSAWS